jgi:hypothetical protein
MRDSHEACRRPYPTRPRGSQNRNWNKTQSSTEYSSPFFQSSLPFHSTPILEPAAHNLVKFKWVDPSMTMRDDRHSDLSSTGRKKRSAGFVGRAAGRQNIIDQ